MQDDSDDSQKFRQFAKDCIRMADRASSSEDKVALLNMAQVWILLADRGYKFPRSLDENS